MPIPDPKPNGEPEPKADEFEMTIEPVEPVGRPRTRRPGFGFLMAIVWCIAFLMLTQIIPGIVVVVVLVALKRPTPEKLTETILQVGSDSFTAQLLAFIGPCCGIAFALWLLSSSVGPNWRKRIALRIPHIEHVVLTLLLIFPFLTFNIALEAILSRLFSNANIPGTREYFEIVKSLQTLPWWTLLLAMSVGPAISEELWCRGFLGRGLVARYGPITGVFMTSLLFGLIHLLPLQAIAAFVMGIALHLVYIATRSILIPMLLHFLNNSLALLSESKGFSLPIGESLVHAYEFSPALMLVAATLMAAAVAWAFWASRVRIWSADGKEQLYYHVALPPESSGDRPRMGPIPLLAVGALLVATCFFGAVWFGM